MGIKRHRRAICLSPHSILVGYSGEIRRDNRLLPLQMTTKYKKFLMQQEFDRSEQIWHLMQLIKKYENISDIINSSRKENKDNMNSNLLQELEEEKKTCKKHLLYVESKLDQLPDNICKSMDKIFNTGLQFVKCKNHSCLERKKNRLQKTAYVNKKHLASRQDCKRLKSTSPVLPTRISKEVDKARPSFSRFFGGVKSQLQVRYNSKLQIISVDLFSNGENLLQILHAQFGGEVNNYDVHFRSRKLNSETSLYEQGIYYMSILDLKIKLDGDGKSVKQNEHNTTVVAPAREKQSFRKDLNTVAAEGGSNYESKSFYGSVKSQLLVKDNNLKLQTISIDLFSNGENFLRLLQDKIGEKGSNYSIYFGSKKLDTKKTLWEQGITHGSTLNLIIPLDGGMESQTVPLKSDKSKNSGCTGNPETWTKLQVGKWVDSLCEEFEIEVGDVSELKTLNGKGLNRLCKEDWERRSPKQGDLFFNMWIKLKSERSSGEAGTSEQRKLDVVPPDEKTLPVATPAEEKSSVSQPSSDVTSEEGHFEDEVHDSSTKGQFGRVDDVKELNDSVTLDSLVNNRESTAPTEGSVISVVGICSEKLPSNDGTRIMLLRDDPRDAFSVSNELKVDIRGKKGSKVLNSRAVGKLLKKIKIGTLVAVRGRVAKLDQDNFSVKQGFKTLKFKLVIDSDDHALVYTKKEMVPFSRQLSQPWYEENYICPAVIDDTNLRVGDSVKKKNGRVFCKSNTSYEEIKKYAVAFKNSYDGDIFVGVEENGAVMGIEFTLEQLTKWREKVVMTIGQILPKTDDKISFCGNSEEANRKIIEKECFISVMKLGDSVKHDSDKISVIAWIHVPKGTAPVHFSKPKDIHVYVRVGAETKRISNYKKLFNCLESLSTRKIDQIMDKEQYIEQQYKKAIEQMTDVHKYKVLKTMKSESHNLEFKMIFGDKPVEKIEKEYLAEYCCGFFNSHPGIIYFGVQEDEHTKAGHVVGIVMPNDQRLDLVKKSVTRLSEFYPPVTATQYHFKFHAVSVPSDCVLKYNKTCVQGKAKCVLLQGMPDKIGDIGKKWPKFIEDKLPDTLCRVIRVKPESFCIVVKKQNCSTEQFMEIVKEYQKINSAVVGLGEMDDSELNQILKDLCVVEVAVVDCLQFPIYMTKPLETCVFNDHGELSKLSPEKLVRRCEDQSAHDFNVEKFLTDVDRFDSSGNSYMMVASPFKLPEFKQDLYGLVIPKWTLAIDFDQDPKEEGHLFQIFEKLHDRYQKERDRFLVTPQDDSLDLNADHGICWLTARGYRGIASSLTPENQGKANWNMTHRKKIESLLNLELTRHVKPNKLHVVILWDEGHRNLIYNLNLLLADILSIYNHTALTFVCSTPAAHTDISRESVKQLQENYWNILRNDSVHVASPHLLAKFLALNLPEIFRPEDNFQVPCKTYSQSGSPIILPETLPQRLRQNIQGRLKIMYMNKSGKPDEESLREERKKFYSGSQITLLGLRGKIGIEREKVAALKKEFEILFKDKKSRISLIVVKADRGAGTTTMCLQFLFKNHDRIPCAQLVEIHRGLLSSIEKINQITNLPLLLLVDEEIGNLQEFLDFKKEAGLRRIVNIIFLLVEPSGQVIDKLAQKKLPGLLRRAKKLRSLRDSSLYGTSSFKEIELRRELQPNEIEKLTDELMKTCKNKKKQDELKDLKDRAAYESGRPLRTFAHFSLTAFGREFSGLADYVKFRLELASDQQKDVLAFLSLTHVFTDYALPAGALARLLKKDTVVMKSEFQDLYVRELLSPPAHETDSRRISFLEVADEILRQLAETTKIETGDGEDKNEDQYWSFIKYVSVKMAREVLSVNIGASKIDRLTRKLFVISEYESEKFSSLIRNMKAENPDIARNTLLELVEVFKKHVSFGAHLLAHLAKYYMIEYKDFKEAKPRIKEAVEGLPDDPLLHHIHGDIIRHHIDALKSEEQVVMKDIVQYAIESSRCFEIVRNERPHMSHGYASDAMVRITVMQAAIKEMGGGEENSFIHYLIQMIDQRKVEGGQLTAHDSYLLALITDAYEFLNESSIDFEYKEKLMDRFLKCIHDVKDLNRLSEKLKSEKNSFSRSDSAWIEEVIIQTHSLLCVLEIEQTKDLSPGELERRIKKIEESGSRSRLDERSMKYWLRYARQLRPAPKLDDVKKRVEQWVNRARKKGGISPHAEFYNYVVCLLIALKDPKDREKMEKAADLVKQQQRKKYSRKEASKFPHVEWLHPEVDRHINSIDSLLYNDDLLKVSSQSSLAHERRRLGRDIIERCLREKNVARWEGDVKDIRSDWQGTIALRGYIDVHFVPQNVRPSIPAKGDTVNFYLSFDWNGPSAWSVMRSVDSTVPRSFPRNIFNGESSRSGSENEEETDSQIIVSSPLHQVYIPEEEEDENDWEHRNGKRMTGVVVSIHPEKGFGYLAHPKVSDHLWFHFSAILNDEEITKHMVLGFRVEKLDGKFRAADICVMKGSEVDAEMQGYVDHLKRQPGNTKPNIATTEFEQPSRKKGVIKKYFVDRGYGFITADDLTFSDDIYFTQKNLADEQLTPRRGNRVQFCMSKNSKGFVAKDVIVQMPSKSTGY